MTAALDIALQPQQINLSPNVGAQLPVYTKGITIVNQTSNVVTLSSDSNFGSPVFLPAGASLPWTTGTVVWAMSPKAGQLLVLPEAYNYYNPNVIPQPVVPTPLLGPVGVTNAANIHVPLTSGLRTLILELFNFGGAGDSVTTVEVIGDNSGIFYYAQAPYLHNFNANQSYTIVVPILANIDATIDVVVFTGSAPNVFQLSVFGDTSIYDESVLYNGPTRTLTVSLAAAATTQLLTGPNRLLTLETHTSGNLSSTISLFPPVSEGTLLIADNTHATLTLPPNYLLYPGNILHANQFGAGASEFTATFAYP